jgi:hypothetical protein
VLHQSASGGSRIQADPLAGAVVGDPDVPGKTTAGFIDKSREPEHRLIVEAERDEWCKFRGILV